MDNNQPIIVKRIKRSAGGHHGGAWKIAFADFAVAMMAFFLVMWLLTVASPEELQQISGYFNDPIGFEEGGSPYAIGLGGRRIVKKDRTLSDIREDESPIPDDTQSESASKTVEQVASEQVEKRELEMLLQELQNKIDVEPVLQRFKDQILLEITQDGLRIQIVDAENRPMFASGSPELRPYFEEILLALSDTIAVVPKKISIGGHTDAAPFVGRRGYGNWELSTERANAARRTLLAAGYPENQLARVVGFADSALFDRADPLNPINRRIDIVVLNKRAEDQILEGLGDQVESLGAPAQQDDSEPPAPLQQSAPPESPAEPLQAPAPESAQEPARAPRSTNFFEDGGDPQSFEE